ncbi:MAG: hypothetical protein ABFD89_06870 [Bryobacteraceae bacterium]
MKVNQFKAKKMAAGVYQIGHLVVEKREPDRTPRTKGYGFITTWIRSEKQGGGMLGYTLKEVLATANTPGSFHNKLARGES